MKVFTPKSFVTAAAKNIVACLWIIIAGFLGACYLSDYVRWVDSKPANQQWDGLIVFVGIAYVIVVVGGAEILRKLVQILIFRLWKK